jgi:hypothetical protein
VEQKICVSALILRLRVEAVHSENWRHSDGQVRFELSTTERGGAGVLEASVVQDLMEPSDLPAPARVYVRGSPYLPGREQIFFLVWDQQRSKDFGAPTFTLTATPIETIDATLVAQTAKLPTIAMGKYTGMEGIVECRPKLRFRDITTHAR